MSDRWTKSYEQTMILFRSNKGEEFLDIHVDMVCPACPDDEDTPYGTLVFTEDEEIVADCPECGYHARVSVYEE